MFIVQEWFEGLKEHAIPFVIRLKELAPSKKRYSAKKTIRRPDLHQQTTLRKPGRVYGHDLYLSAIRHLNDSVIIDSNTPGDYVLWNYKAR